MEKILILDFGSQYTQLIARRVRELNVYCEIHPFNKIPAIDASVRGVILSGSPFSVRDAQAPTPDLSAIKGKLPLLGVCYGAQFLASAFGGEVQPAPSREYGRAVLTVGDAGDPLMRGLPATTQVWMSHGDTITSVPANYKIVASTEDVRVAAFRIEGEQTWGIQFHPEVYHSTDGTQLLKNFVVDICGCGQSWTSEGFVEATVRELREKLGDDKVVLGLSGGVDSALTLAIAADALGPDRVRAVMMPTEYTADISLEDAEKLARTLGVRYDVIAISSVFNQYMTMLNPYFEGRPWDVTEENLQARIRGMILMALSNKTGALVLTTGNKSESAVGYSTLYGDLAGGFALIRDVLKTRVYRLCAWRNRQEPVIPERILTRAPSAELREGQKDEDSLPPYAVLDRIIESYVEKRMAPGDIARLDGMNPETVKRIITMIHRSEYKRRQSPTGPRISPVGFGRDWRYNF